MNNEKEHLEQMRLIENILKMKEQLLKRPKKKKKQFLPEKIARTIPKLYEQDGVSDPTVYVKFFTPDANWTWYVTEYDGEDTFYGLVNGHESEFGYFSKTELENTRGALGLKVERDLYFQKTTIRNLR